MRIIERDPIPERCQTCKEEECYNCDYMEDRWFIYPIDKMKIRRKMLSKAVERLQREIAELDKEIAEAENEANKRTQEAWERFKTIYAPEHFK